MLYTDVINHVRDQKGFTISLNVSNKTSNEILEEMAKCDIRCTNCHLQKQLLAAPI